MWLVCGGQVRRINKSPSLPLNCPSPPLLPITLAISRGEAEGVSSSFDTRAHTHTLPGTPYLLTYLLTYLVTYLSD